MRIATLERARAKFADDYLLEILSAQAFEKGKDYTNAVNRLYHRRKSSPRRRIPKLLRTTLFISSRAPHERAAAKRNRDQAEKCFEKSLELKAGLGGGVELPRLYVGRPRHQNLDEALDLIQKSVEARAEECRVSR